jgi:hypothetical protein
LSNHQICWLCSTTPSLQISLISQYSSTLYMSNIATCLLFRFAHFQSIIKWLPQVNLFNSVNSDYAKYEIQTVKQVTAMTIAMGLLANSTTTVHITKS